MRMVADKQRDKLIASSNSTNLIAHLNACHKAEFEQFTEKEKARKLTIGRRQTQSQQITTYLRQSSVWPERSTEVKVCNDAK